MSKLKDLVSKVVVKEVKERDGTVREVRGLDDPNHPVNVNKSFQENKLPSLND